MNTTTMIIGAAVLLFGLYITGMRFVRPEKLSKLEALKDLFGEKTGNLLHLAAYSILPLVTGALFLFAGSQGISIF